MTVMRDSHHHAVTATPAKITRRQRRERRLRYPWGRFSPLLPAAWPLFAVGDRRPAWLPRWSSIPVVSPPSASRLSW